MNGNVAQESNVVEMSFSVVEPNPVDFNHCQQWMYQPVFG
jgi:hypothetical protein